MWNRTEYNPSLVYVRKNGSHVTSNDGYVCAIARTTIREPLDYGPDVIEAQLDHKPPGPLGGGL